MPALNTTSAADISFILLIFFLVTTSLDTDLGLVRQLPPMPKEENQDVMNVERDKVMQINIAADDATSLDGKPASLADIGKDMKAFIEMRPTEHIISIHADRQSSYDRYFQIQNLIVDTYRSLRDTYCRKRFGRPFAQCTPENQAMAVKAFPQRISEQVDTEESTVSATNEAKGGGK